MKIRMNYIVNVLFISFFVNMRPMGTVKIVCRYGFRYNPIKKECVKKEEKEEKEHREKNEETEVEEEEKTVAYNLQLLLDSPTALNVSSREFIPSFDPFVQNLAKANNVSTYMYSVGDFRVSPEWWQRLNPSQMKHRQPSYFFIQMNVNAKATQTFEETIFESLGTTIPVMYHGKNISFQLYVFTGSYDVGATKEVYGYPGDSNCCNVTAGIFLFLEMLCPYVSLTLHKDYKLEEGGLRFMFEGLERASDPLGPSFTFHGDDRVTVCTDTYERYYNETWMLIQQLTHPIGLTLWTVTVACLSLSLVGLFLTFLTYCVFPELRNIPAKNNIGLIVCLFMAQLIYIVGFLKTENHLLCQIFAICEHYFRLASFFWMNVCCFHVFKGFVLSKTISTRPTRSCSIMSKYAIYANGLPVLVIAAVITTSQILSDGHATGYVGRFCFLSTVLLNGLTLVLPLCLVLISNFIYFVATICTINNTKQIRRNTGGERQNMCIYIKLSSITGLSWMLSIVGATLNSPALDYITTILSSSQGLFLFMSYCCNKRVLGLWRGRLLKEGDARVRTGSSKSDKTKETDDTYVKESDNTNVKETDNTNVKETDNTNV